MKKKISIILSVIMIIMSLTGVVYADSKSSISFSEIELNGNESILVEDISFLSDAEINITHRNSDESEILLTRKSNLNNGTCRVESVLIVVEEDDVDIALDTINKAKMSYSEGIANQRSTQGPPLSDWYLGSSLYMEVSVVYDTISSGLRTFYKMESVSAKAMAYNGTTISNKTLVLEASGTTQELRNYSKTSTLNITSYGNTYTTTIPNNWEYIAPGLLLGANLQCTAARPSGSSAVYTLPYNLFYGI